MGEVAEQVGRFVNAYSGDLKDESLDGQRIVVGGIVTGRPDRRHEAQGDDGDRRRSRTCRARSRSSSSRACTRRRRPTWRDGAILLVAGRVDHRGRGGLAPRRPRRGLGRRRRRGARRRSPARSPRAIAGPAAAAGNGRGPVDGNGNGAPRPMVAVGPGAAPVPVVAGAGVGEPPAVAFVSPLRVDADGGVTDVRVDLGAAADRAGRTGPDLRRGRSVAALAPDRDRGARRAGRGARPDRGRGDGRRPVGCRSRRDPARPLRRIGRLGPRGRRRWSWSSCCSATGRARRAS